MAGIGDYKKNTTMAFKMKSGNKPTFKNMGSSPLNMFGGPSADRPLGVVGSILDPLGIFAPKKKKEDKEGQSKNGDKKNTGQEAEMKSTDLLADDSFIVSDADLPPEVS